MKCEDCGKDLNPVVVMLCGNGPLLCKDCVKARHKAAIGKK